MIAPGANKEEQEILRKFGFKMETAYMEVPILTDEEKIVIRNARIGASSEVENLLNIIDRLTGNLT